MTTLLRRVQELEFQLFISDRNLQQARKALGDTRHQLHVLQRVVVVNSERLINMAQSCRESDLDSDVEPGGGFKESDISE